MAEAMEGYVEFDFDLSEIKGILGVIEDKVRRGKKRRFDIMRARPHANIEQLTKTFGNESFANFAEIAYHQKNGMAIRVNPMNGQKELFVAGTRDATDWMHNALNVPMANIKFGSHNLLWLDKRREKRIRQIERAIQKYDVDVVYGHSRGAALVADVKAEHVQKIGLDGAMLLAGNKKMLNIQDRSTIPSASFDKLIGIGGKSNVGVRLGKKFHHAWD